MVKSGGALVKTAGVRRLAKPESLTIEVMAEFVTQRAQECSERSQLLADSRARPDANHPVGGRVIAEELCRPTALPDA
jgi:hypothetical protein